MYTDIRTEKMNMREKFKSQRDNIPAQQRAEASDTIFGKISNLISYRNADTVLIYHSIKSEVETLRFAQKALEDGKRVAFPKCGDNREMFFGYISSLNELTPGKFHIPEPDANSERYDFSNTNAICIVPALAFDKKGFRIGYGGGYYDNFLKNFKGSKIGVAFYQFIVENIPHSKYDNSVDVIITERKVFSTNA